MRLKAVDLKKRCADAGLDDSGTKADLVGRLLNQASNEDSSPPDAGDAPERVVGVRRDDALSFMIYKISAHVFTHTFLH